jgi:tetratricopeptide (TPR) repeat protein
MEITFNYKDMTILVAEDKMSMLRTLTNMLRVIGFEKIIRVDDGDKAIVKLRTEKLDLILSDWNMPTTKGIDVLRAVREDDQLRPIPFLMITGEVDLSIVAEAGEVEVDGYLLKPFTHEDLKIKIDEVLTKKRTPSPIDVHLSVARVYMDARQYDMALDELKKALKLNSRSPRISMALGEIHEAQNDLLTARKFYTRAVEFGKGYLKGHEALARVSQSLGDIQGAVDNLKQAVRISPKNIDRQMVLGKCLIQTGQKDQFVRVMQNALRTADHNRAEVAHQIGEAFLEAGMAEEAQNAYTQALEADPTALHVYNRLGIALRRQKKFDEAIINYQRAIQIDPEDERLYYNLGRAFFEAGAKAKAVAAMKKALQLFPDFKEAKDFLTKVGTVTEG